MSQFRASPSFTALLTTSLFTLGSVPGYPNEIGLIHVFGGSPNLFLSLQYAFDLVES